MSSEAAKVAAEEVGGCRGGTVVNWDRRIAPNPVQAASKDLPKPWKAVWDADSKDWYYWNADTDETTWIKPSAVNMTLPPGWTVRRGAMSSGRAARGLNPRPCCETGCV